MLGRSAVVAVGLMETRTFRNATLSASARAYASVSNLLYFNDSFNTYLIISGDELCNGLQYSSSCKLTRPSHRLKLQVLLNFFVVGPAILFCIVFLLHLLPHLAWNCMMIHRYAGLVTTFFIHLIMLANVLTNGRVSSFVECLSLSMRLCEVFVISENCKSY